LKPLKPGGGPTGDPVNIAGLAFLTFRFWMLMTDRRVTRHEGAVLLVTYGLYLAALIVLTLTAGR